MLNVKKISVILCLIVLSSSVSASALARNFLDVGVSHWAHQEIEKMSGQGIISGYPDGSFRPDLQVTCGEFIKMAVGLLPKTVDPEPGSHWAMPYYNAGIEMSLYSSYDISPKALDRPIKRSLMALIGGSMLEAGSFRLSSTEYSKCLDSIRDVNSKTPYESFIVKSYAKGILAGYPDGTFRPNAMLNRAEAALVIHRLKENLSFSNDAVNERDSCIAIEKESDIFPSGTITLTVIDYEKDKDTKHKEIRQLLLQHSPLIGEEIYSALLDFGTKPLGLGRQGMRKQCFGDVPVLMERLDTTLRIFILPKGYENPFWETGPDEINEEFF